MIEPMLGVNGIEFGASPQEVEEKLGLPEDVREPESNDDTLAWHFKTPDLMVCFERSPEWEFVSCETTDPAAQLGGASIIGMRQLEAIGVMRRAGLVDIHILDEGDETRVIARGQSVTFWIQDERVWSVQWGELE